MPPSRPYGCNPFERSLTVILAIAEGGTIHADPFRPTAVRSLQAVPGRMARAVPATASDPAPPSPKAFLRSEIAVWANEGGAGGDVS